MRLFGFVDCNKLEYKYDEIYTTGWSNWMQQSMQCRIMFFLTRTEMNLVIRSLSFIILCTFADEYALVAFISCTNTNNQSPIFICKCKQHSNAGFGLMLHTWDGDRKNKPHSVNIHNTISFIYQIFRLFFLAASVAWVLVSFTCLLVFLCVCGVTFNFINFMFSCT